MAKRGNPRQTIHEEAREIPIVADYDVCVIGGSCTGVFAAVSAARLGARVAVVENNGFFGGLASAGLWPHWKRIPYDMTGRTQIVAGLTMEVVERLRKRRASFETEPRKEGTPAGDSHQKYIENGSPRSHTYVLNSEELKIELDALVVEAGVRPFLHTHFVAPVLSDGKLVAVVIEDKTGRRAIKASYFVDASGDGDLIARMGLPLLQRAEVLQPPSTCAVVRGLEEIQKNHPGFSLEQAAFHSKHPIIKPGWFRTAKIPNSRDDWWMGGTTVMGGVDCADADQLTEAEMDGRRQVRALCDILREKMPDDLDPLVMLSTVIGIRETRHAQCLYTLTETELLNGKHFHDAIANGIHGVDIHHSDKPGITVRFLDGTEALIVPGEQRKYARWRDEGSEGGTFFQLPYRALVPQGATNVLVAGRDIGADVGAFSSIRNMPFCNQEGEAAGTASYLALDGNISVAEVDTNKLREIMKKQGSAII